MIGRNGERRSGISAQAARHDDDDDDIRIINLFPSCYVFLIKSKNTKKINRTSSDLMDKITIIYIYIYIYIYQNLTLNEP